MALVAYDNSDSSDYDENDVLNETAITSNKITEPLVTKKDIAIGLDKTEEQHALFNFLPQPSKKKPTVVEEDDEFLYKKATPSSTVKPKAKIMVPSLDEFKDVNSTTNSKPRIHNGKKSGLLSILPQPKNMLETTINSLIPDILKQKLKPNATSQKKEFPSSMKKTTTETIKKLSIDYSDDSEDDDVHNDFFSINKPSDFPNEDTLLDIDNKVLENVEQVSAPSSQKTRSNIQSYFKQDVPDTVMEHEDNPISSEDTEPSFSYENQDNTNGNITLDEEAIRQLCGSRGKRKKEEIQIVDVNQTEVLAEARQWLLKSLMDDTSKRVSASKRKGNEPTGQQKRKHQITYLAHQAKANEAELQNQWANNRMSKRKTQSKYGF